MVHVTADALTTGRAALFESDSSDNSNRSVVKIHNDNAKRHRTKPLTVLQDAPSTEVADFLHNNTETVFGPKIRLFRGSTTVADDMGLDL